MTTQVSASTRPITTVTARNNPLSVQRVSQLAYRFASGDWPHHLTRLESLNFRAAIVGQQGSGKTTLLSELHQRIRFDLGIRAHHVFLPHETTAHQQLIDRAWIASDEGEVVLIDGFERLGLWTRLRLIRETCGRAGLILNLHQPLRGPYRLPVWIRCETSFELLCELLEELGLTQCELMQEAKKLFDQQRGNIRMVLRDLYDQIAIGELDIQNIGDRLRDGFEVHP